MNKSKTTTGTIRVPHTNAAENGEQEQLLLAQQPPDEPQGNRADRGIVPGGRNQRQQLAAYQREGTGRRGAGSVEGSDGADAVHGEVEDGDRKRVDPQEKPTSDRRFATVEEEQFVFDHLPGRQHRVATQPEEHREVRGFGHLLSHKEQGFGEDDRYFRGTAAPFDS